MVCVCSKCLYMFEQKKQTDGCPHCGSTEIRAAEAWEQSAYREYQAVDLPLMEE